MRFTLSFLLLALMGLLYGCDDDPESTPVDAHVEADARAADAHPDEGPPPQDAALIDDAMPADQAVDVLSADRSLIDAEPEIVDAEIVDAAPPPPWPEGLEPQAYTDGAADLEAPVPAGSARAGVVDDPAEALTGPAARCAVGNLRLDNAVISACIQDAQTWSQITSWGGDIIDAHLATEPNGDLLDQIIALPGLGEVRVLEIGVVAEGGEGQAAVIRLEGDVVNNRMISAALPQTAYPELRVITEYRLEPDADEIQLMTWLQATGRRVEFSFSEILFLGDRTQTLVPGQAAGEPPRGAEVMYADGPALAYSWRHVGEVIQTNPFISVLDVPAVEHPRIALQPGEWVMYERLLRIGPDIEGIRAAPEGAVEVTFIGPEGLRLQINDAVGGVTRLRLDASGRRIARLAPGAYQAQSIGWPGGDMTLDFEAAAGAEITLEAATPARLALRVEDQAGEGLGAKVWLSGPQRRVEFVLDDMELELPAGQWTAVTTRGWHYSADERGFTLEAGARHEETIVLDEVIPFEGWTSGEFHQHAAPSVDSEVPEEDRVLSNVVEGVGFMVGSDHDVIYDYAGLAARMGVTERLGVPVTGVEVSTLMAHLGAYGMPYQPRQSGGGAPALFKVTDTGAAVRTVPEVIAAAREGGAEVIQLNHPRGSGGLFKFIDVDFSQPIAEIEHVQWTPDFDSVEVFNGTDNFCPVLADWMSLLNQGLRITGVGNSDTHSRTSPPGAPRNYLPTAAPRASEVSAPEVFDALLSGVIFVGSGAYMDFPDGPQPGDTVDAVDLRVRIRTPPFSSIRRLLAFHNGEVVFDQGYEVDPAEIVDVDQRITLELERDGALIFLALGEDPMAYVANDPVFAFSNPIWVDVDGGGITPLGAGPIALPEMTICR